MWSKPKKQSMPASMQASPLPAVYGFTLEDLYWVKKWTGEKLLDVQFIVQESHYNTSSRRHLQEEYKRAVEQQATLQRLSKFFGDMEHKLRKKL